MNVGRSPSSSSGYKLRYLKHITSSFFNTKIRRKDKKLSALKIEAQLTEHVKIVD